MAKLKTNVNTWIFLTYTVCFLYHLCLGGKLYINFAFHFSYAGIIQLCLQLVLKELWGKEELSEEIHLILIDRKSISTHTPGKKIQVWTFYFLNSQPLFWT